MQQKRLGEKIVEPFLDLCFIESGDGERKRRIIRHLPEFELILQQQHLKCRYLQQNRYR